MNNIQVWGAMVGVMLSLSACGGGDDGIDSSTSDTTTQSNGTGAGTTPTSNTTTGGTTTGATTGATTGGSTTPTAEAGLLVGSDEARSCELMMVDTQGTFDQVLFNDTVQGQVLRRGQHIAVAFASRTDAAIEAGAVQVQMAEGAAEGVELTTARCFNAAGDLIAQPGIELKP